MRQNLLTLLVVGALLAGNSLQAAAPRLTNILPHGVQRGTEVTLQLSGSNLEDAEELLLYDSGMEVLEFTHPEDANQKGKVITVKLRVAADCPLGSQRLRIRTRSGISDLQNVAVGALPVIEEKEPNTDFSAPQSIPMNHTVHGRIDREDVDYFVVEAKQGERITAEVYGMRLGFTDGANFFDPYVAILNEERFELSVADDTTLVWNDSVASIIAPQDGKYIIQVRDASYNGDGRAYYLLHVGNFPRPQATVPAGGRPGETIDITFLGDVAGPFTRTVTLPTEVPERFGLEVSDEQGIAPTPNPFRLVDVPNMVEQEPNNDRTQASAGSAPGAFNGVIQEPGDVDFFKFSAAKDQQYDIEVYARRIRSPLDPVLSVHRADNGAQLAANDDSRGQDSYLRFKAPEDGEYCIAIRDHLNSGSAIHTYRVEVLPVSPRLSGEPVEIARYVQPNMTIPQGAGSGIVVNVQRQDFGGPVEFVSDNLPAGVRMESPPGWAGSGTIPLVFYADADAPVAGQYCDIWIRRLDPNQPASPEAASAEVSGERMGRRRNREGGGTRLNLAGEVAGRLTQKQLMIRGVNNNRVWDEEHVRVPIIVTEKAPFRVWIDPPKVPIVRGGSMNLKVICERDEGWNEEIQLLMLQDAPGVNSSRSVKFAAGQTEVTIPMNAAGNAAVQETMIALRCIAKVGNGNIELTTPFVPLRVEEQYITFEFAQAAAEQGQEVPVVVKVSKRKDFEGEAEVELVGLPANATAEKIKLSKETEELVFTVKVAENTPAGDNKNLLCQVYVPESGELIHHSLGTGRLRVDVPLPPKKDEPKPEPMPMPVVQQAAPPKPLSRLEQLRLQKKAAESTEGSNE